MNPAAIEQAKRAAVRARGRLDDSIAALLQRLRPANLADEGWQAVKHKGAEIADDAMGAVKKRATYLSLAAGAVALFAAREPLGRTVARLLSDESEEEEAPAAVKPPARPRRTTRPRGKKDAKDGSRKRQ